MGYLYLVSFLALIATSLGIPEQGKFSATLSDKVGIVGFTKTLYANSTVKLFVTKSKCEGSFELRWLVRSTTCFGEYQTAKGLDDPAPYLNSIFDRPEDPQRVGSGFYQKSDPEKIQCGTAHSLQNYEGEPWVGYPKVVATQSPKADNKTETPGQRRKREDKEDDDPGKDDEADTKSKDADHKDENVDAKAPETKEKDAVDDTNPPDKADEGQKETAVAESPSSGITKTSKHIITRVPSAAPYMLVVKVTGDIDSVEITAEMETPLGYLSAHEYPLKTFYMIMCIVYSFYAAGWLVMSACNFKDLLRVQFWIGGVILLGMIEKAVFYSEYLSVNSTGISVMGASKFAEVVSAMKRALARMLVIIVSLGFGIVKPRLGPMLHRVIGIGILYFILAIVEALIRTDGSTHPGNKNLLFASIPLAIVDSIICWWIFMSLMQTMKTLRLRRNVVKLSLYRHFSNTIIFCVIASLAMIFYSFRYRNECMSAWKEMWIDVAFWHVLFSVILLVIMILWRPNVNNQRYAFSPLLDAEEGAEEPMLGSGATETVTMRGLKKVNEQRQDAAGNAEENLKWIEENIPQTVADAALPAIMDSDEEIMTTKYEMSKME